MQAFDDAWQAALLLFGIHLLLLGYLTYRSAYVPRAIGALVAVAGVGYAFDSAASILTGDVWNVSAVTFIGEAVLAVWLALRGSRIDPGHVPRGIALQRAGNGTVIPRTDFRVH